MEYTKKDLRQGLIALAMILGFSAFALTCVIVGIKKLNIEKQNNNTSEEIDTFDYNLANENVLRLVNSQLKLSGYEDEACEIVSISSSSNEVSFTTTVGNDYLSRISIETDLDINQFIFKLGDESHNFLLEEHNVSKEMYVIDKSSSFITESNIKSDCNNLINKYYVGINELDNTHYFFTRYKNDMSIVSIDKLEFDSSTFNYLLNPTNKLEVSMKTSKYAYQLLYLPF